MCVCVCCFLSLEAGNWKEVEQHRELVLPVPADLWFMRNTSTQRHNHKIPQIIQVSMLQQVCKIVQAFQLKPTVPSRSNESCTTRVIRVHLLSATDG